MKGIIFITNSNYLVRFIASNAFKELEEKHDILFAVNRSPEKDFENNVFEYLDPERQKIEWQPHYPIREKKWQELFDISCILHQDKSRSFAVRNEEKAKFFPQYYQKIKSLSEPEIYKQYRAAQEQEMGLHPDILALVKRHKPDFIVLPSGILDALTDELLLISEKMNIPLVILTAGWDNLSSKGLLYRQPTILGVWGEQSRQHAIDVQNCDANRIHIIGAPHYEHYRRHQLSEDKNFRNILGVPDNRPLLMFGGGVRLFDETRLLGEMDEAIESGTLPPLYIIYRPHPARWGSQIEANFFDYPWKNVSMDPALVDIYQAKKKGYAISSVYRVDYLAQLYRTIDCLISPMSTVLLEAMLFGLPSMAVAFSDGVHSWSADKGSEMMHFNEMYEVPEFIVCRDRDRYFEDVTSLVKKIGNPQVSQSLSQSAQYFVCQGENTYAERVVQLVDDMLAKSQKPSYEAIKLKPGRRYRWQQFWRSDLRFMAKKALQQFRRFFYRIHPTS